jgi:hypothetical protein
MGAVRWEVAPGEWVDLEGGAGWVLDPNNAGGFSKEFIAEEKKHVERTLNELRATHDYLASERKSQALIGRL